MSIENNLLEYNNQLTIIEKISDDIIIQIRENKLENLFSNFIEFTEVAFKIVNLISTLKQDNYAGNLLAMDKVNGFLIEINTALENKDYFLIADILEYDFVPSLGINKN